MKAHVLWVFFAILLLGCHPKRVETTVVEPPTGVLEVARGRAVPDRLKVRFTVKLRSKPLELAGSTSGGLLVDRPGKGRLELFGPMGGTLLTVLSDGEGLSVLLPGPRKHLVAADAEAVLRETTGGVAGLDDALALLVGDLPFKKASPRRVEALPADEEGLGGVLVTLDGPKETTVDMVLDPEIATPRRIIARDSKGEPVISAVYDRFERVADEWMPTRVEVYIPSLDLLVEARYRGWEPLAEEGNPFALDVPADFATEPLDSVIRGVVEKARPR